MAQKYICEGYEAVRKRASCELPEYQLAARLAELILKKEVEDSELARELALTVLLAPLYEYIDISEPGLGIDFDRSSQEVEIDVYVLQ